MSDANDLPEHDDPPQFDAGDPKAVGDRATAIKLRERESERFWDAVFASAVGRREMWGILQACHAFEDTFACGPNGFPQPEATWFKAGEAAIGRRMYQTWLVRHTESVAAMHRENDPQFAPPAKPKRQKGSE